MDSGSPSGFEDSASFKSAKVDSDSGSGEVLKEPKWIRIRVRERF